jgi:hypothetical protein
MNSQSVDFIPRMPVGDWRLNLRLDRRTDAALLQLKPAAKREGTELIPRRQGAATGRDAEGVVG